jgi:p-hydroxybenzoate 3-monooxygenase
MHLISMKTQVGIAGAGPAGLLLARILQVNGINSVILERRSREYVLKRIRAGVLEPGTVDTLTECGVGGRLASDGLPIDDVQIRWNGERHVIPIVGEDGRRLTTYGQAKVVRDLMEQRESDGLPIFFEAEVIAYDSVTNHPEIHFRHNGSAKSLACDFIAGCDGFHGVSRTYIPEASAKSFLKELPFAWFGILADAKPKREIRGFAHSIRGLAVASARSQSIGRLYLQVDPDFDINMMTDEEIWDELDRRMDDGSGDTLTRGSILEKSVARLRGFVCEAMQHGKLFIAGDAAHIVPPSGAKGLNLAVSDVRVLAEAIRRYLRNGDSELIDNYSKVCLQRIWPTVHWSCSMSEALHLFPGQTAFDTRMQYETLSRWANTETGRLRFREAMLGLPYEI